MYLKTHLIKRATSATKTTFKAIIENGIARSVQDYSDSLDDVALDKKLSKVQSIFTLLANDPHPEVRIALVDEIAIALDRLSSFDHDVIEVVKTLEKDSGPRVQAAYSRQVEHGFFEYYNTHDFVL